MIRSEPSTSPRHYGTNNRSSETISSIMMQTQVPSMILRDTSIREQLSSTSIKDSSSYNISTGYNSPFASRDQCGSSFINSNNGLNSLNSFHNPLMPLGSRDNNAVVLRDSAINHSSTRVASNRFLSGGLDQRIIKQSTEDCRRLLQQVRLNIYGVEKRK